MSDMVMIALSLLVLASGFCISTIVLAFAWRRARRQQHVQVSRELEAMNAHFEQLTIAVDAIAVEVERIGEAERFTAKALASRSGKSLEGRVITPH
ncbi:MAG: hypothetical protein WD801_03475 [Gemmatimonadaceae bacterium]